DPTSGETMLERHTTHPHGLPTGGISHAPGVFVDRATAGGTLSSGAAQALALPLAVRTDHERGAAPGHAKHQTAGAQVALLAPQVIFPAVLEPLSDPAALLGMAILRQQHLG